LGVPTSGVTANRLFGLEPAGTDDTLSRLTENLYGPRELRRTGVVSALFVVAILALGLVELGRGNRPRGVRLLVLGAALGLCMAVGIILSRRSGRDVL